MFITLIQAIFLIIIACQDFKSRSVSLLFLVLFGISSLVHGVLINGFSVFPGFVGINLLILVFILTFVSLYFILKYRRLVFIFDTHIGWGDIVFFVTLSLLFSPVNFLSFFVFSLILSLLVAIVMRLSKNSKNIPLAGLLATLLVPVLLFCHFANINCYSDNRVLLFFTQLVNG
jgi:hypothetical protein